MVEPTTMHQAPILYAADTLQKLEQPGATEMAQLMEPGTSMQQQLQLDMNTNYTQPQDKVVVETIPIDTQQSKVVHVEPNPTVVHVEAHPQPTTVPMQTQPTVAQVPSHPAVVQGVAPATTAQATTAKEHEPMSANSVVILDLLIPGLGHLLAEIPTPEFKLLYPKFKSYPSGWVYLASFLGTIAALFIFVFLLVIPIIGWIIDVFIIVLFIIAQVVLRIFACKRANEMQQKVIEKWNREHNVMPSTV